MHFSAQTAAAGLLAMACAAHAIPAGEPQANAEALQARHVLFGAPAVLPGLQARSPRSHGYGKPGNLAKSIFDVRRRDVAADEEPELQARRFVVTMHKLSPEEARALIDGARPRARGLGIGRRSPEPEPAMRGSRTPDLPNYIPGPSKNIRIRSPEPAMRGFRTPDLPNYIPGPSKNIRIRSPEPEPIEVKAGRTYVRRPQSHLPFEANLKVRGQVDEE